MRGLVSVCMLSGSDGTGPQQFLDDYLALVEVGSHKQLFFGDRVILEKVGTRRVFHRPRKLSQNPLLRPKNPEETNVVKPAAILYGPRISRFCLWYGCECGDETMSVAYAESDDAIRWERRASTPDGRSVGAFDPFNKVWFRDPQKPNEIGQRVMDSGTIVYHPWEKAPNRH